MNCRACQKLISAIKEGREKHNDGQREGERGWVMFLMGYKIGSRKKGCPRRGQEGVSSAVTGRKGTGLRQKHPQSNSRGAQ